MGHKHGGPGLIEVAEGARRCHTGNKKAPPNPAALAFGGARRDRTADLYNAIVALSQLSYSPVRAARSAARGAAF